MINIIVTLILLAIIIPAAAYIARAKKKGQTCIGCPSASKCAKSCHCENSKAAKM